MVTQLSNPSLIPFPLSSSSSEKVVDLLQVLPYGPLRMVPHDLTQVETSINIGTSHLPSSRITMQGKVELLENNFNVHPFARSSCVYVN